MISWPSIEIFWFFFLERSAFCLCVFVELPLCPSTPLYHFLRYLKPTYLVHRWSVGCFNLLFGFGFKMAAGFRFFFAHLGRFSCNFESLDIYIESYSYNINFFNLTDVGSYQNEMYSYKFIRNTITRQRSFVV